MPDPRVTDMHTLPYESPTHSSPGLSSHDKLPLTTSSLKLNPLQVQIALDEAGAEYSLFQVDVIRNKPDWYKHVNPLGKVPALTFGGPYVPPDEPSPESEKLVESLALLEFVADVFPESGLLPADPVLRARARTFIELYHSYVHDELCAVFFRGAPGVDAFLQGLETLQGALPPAGFAAGAWSLAEAGVAPFLTRILVYLEAGLGRYSDADGEKMRAALASARFARLRQYVQDVRARPSFAKSWGGDVSAVLVTKSPDIG
ncbi:hypothetical protein TRAPUB_4138 [Trametes pubescens]|uniref:GST N-terminal domain-containing protein n=1 Tax=Trametes pubescens TaxID=154538 RepID=A0A1M2VC11_TRAPU|nr:hypothetical protein TRAPUB_4138 [Trametes pubescens]